MPVLPLRGSLFRGSPGRRSPVCPLRLFRVAILILLVLVTLPAHSRSRGYSHRFGIATATPPEVVNLVVLATSDVHGEIMPYDEISEKTVPRGLACLSTLIRGIREKHPQAILIDNGDTLLGSSLAHYHRRFMPELPNPVIQAMNVMGYEALVVGNHEFDEGLPFLASAAAQASFPFLSANIRQGNKPRFKPWRIIERHGVKVAIIGLTTTGIPHWVNPEHYAGLTFADPVAPARLAVNEVKQAGADIVILAAHLGSGVNLKNGKPIAEASWEGNIGFSLARQVPGIDAIILGHTHELLATTTAGIPVVQPKALGTHLARLDLKLERRENVWHILERQSSLIPVASDTRPDFPLQAMATVLTSLTQRYLDTPLATSPRHLAAMGCAFVDHPVTDLVLTAMLEASQADVALSALPPGNAFIPSGTVRIRDVHRLYNFDNSIVLVSLTGTQLKEVLEHSARFFHGWQSQKTQLDLINPAVAFFNCDLAAGIEYAIDLRQPVGKRISSLTWRKKPLPPNQILRVALSNYRFNGGGEYPALARGLDPERLPVEIRAAIIRKLMWGPALNLKADGNWRLLPEEIHRLPRTRTP